MTDAASGEIIRGLRLDLMAHINRKKGKRITVYSVIILVVALIISCVFISDVTKKNLGNDFLKFVLVFISYFITKILISGLLIKNDKALGVGENIFYNVAIIFCCFIASFFLSHINYYGEKPGSPTDYNLVFEYFTIISIPSFIGAYKSYTDDRKMSRKERFQKRYEQDRAQR